MNNLLVFQNLLIAASATLAFLSTEVDADHRNRTWTFDGTSMPEEGEDGTGGVSVMLKVTSTMVCVGIIACIVFSRNREGPDMSSSERGRENEFPEGAAALADGGGNSEYATMMEIDPEYSERLIKAAIISRKVVGFDEKSNIIMEGQDCVTPSTLKEEKDKENKNDDENEKNNSMFSFNSETHYENDVNNPNVTCVICLNRFEVGQELSWSRTLQCKHIFHSECVKPWFRKHDDCPCCRTKLIMDTTMNDSSPAHFSNSQERHRDSTTGREEEQDESIYPSVLSTSSSMAVSPEESGTFYVVNGLVSRARRITSIFQRAGSDIPGNETVEVRSEVKSPSINTNTAEPSTVRQIETDEEAPRIINNTTEPSSTRQEVIQEAAPRIIIGSRETSSSIQEDIEEAAPRTTNTYTVEPSSTSQEDIEEAAPRIVNNITEPSSTSQEDIEEAPTIIINNVTEPSSTSQENIEEEASRIINVTAEPSSTIEDTTHEIDEEIGIPRNSSCDQ